MTATVTAEIPTTQFPPVNIGNLIEIHMAIARTEVKVDALLKDKDDLELRIRGLERWRWGIPGAGLAALLGVLGTWLGG